RNAPDEASIQLDQSVLDEIATPGVYVEILNEDGVPIQKSTNLTSELPLGTKRATSTSSETLETHRASNGERLRILHMPIGTEATGDFSRRIEGERQRGEVGDLVRTLNELIAKVESTLDAHRSFLADSSHELRRPLAVVRGNLEVLRSGALPAEEREQVIAETEVESRRMSRILSDLLLLSQVDARLILQRSPSDLGELLL